MYGTTSLPIAIAPESRTNWTGLGEGISRPGCGIVLSRRHPQEAGFCVDKYEWSCHRPNCSNPHCVKDWIEIQVRQAERGFDRWKNLDFLTVGAAPAVRDGFQVIMLGSDRKKAAAAARGAGMRRGFTVIHRGGEGKPCPKDPHVHCVGLGYWIPDYRATSGCFRTDLRGLNSGLLEGLLARAVVPSSSSELKGSKAPRFVTWFGETKKRFGHPIPSLPEPEMVAPPPKVCPKCGKSVERGLWEFSRDDQNWVRAAWTLVPRPIRWDLPSNWAEINDLETNGIRP